MRVLRPPLRAARDPARLQAVSIGLVRAAILWYASIVIVAQSAAPVRYNWVRNTVSELAAQGYPWAWTMRIGFIGFGLLLSVGLAARMAAATDRRAVGRHALLQLYALLMFASGFASTAPFIPGLRYSAAEAYWHSVFATGAGLAIVASMLWHFLAETTPHRRSLHLAGLAAVVVLSALFGLAEARLLPSLQGLIQRALHAAGLLWIWFAYAVPGRLAAAGGDAGVMPDRLCAGCGRPLDPLRSEYCTACLLRMELRGAVAVGDRERTRALLPPLSAVILGLAFMDACATIYGYQRGFITEANPYLERLLERSPALMCAAIVAVTVAVLVVMWWALARRPDLIWTMWVVLAIRAVVALMHVAWIIRVVYGVWDVGAWPPGGPI